MKANGKKEGKRKEGAIYLANLGEGNPRLDIMCKYLHKAAKSTSKMVLNPDEMVCVRVCVCE